MNMQQMIAEGRGAYKLSPKKVIEIRQLIRDKVSNRKIAKLYGVSDKSISRIKTNDRWQNIK